jgi:hypothetical protein
MQGIYEETNLKWDYGEVQETENILGRGNNYIREWTSHP